MVEINMYLFLQEPSLLDLTEDLFHDNMCTSVEPEFKIPDKVYEIDNSLDHEVSYYYNYQSAFEISDSESGDDLYDIDTSFVSEMS